MSLAILDHTLHFPPAENADEDGLLAVGGDLSVQRLLLAYQRGIFPWYDDEVPLWWSPDPRFVLFPHELKVSKSMQRLMKKDTFDFTINKAFTDVMHHCKIVYRKDQQGTWISNVVEDAYTQLHQLGYAESAEVWLNGRLVGGLYGVRLGKVFFGESMFSNVSNASKYAFIQYVAQLIKEDVQLIDCQVYTSHLESLGAKMVARKYFIELIHQLIMENEGNSV